MQLIRSCTVFLRPAEHQSRCRAHSCGCRNRARMDDPAFLRRLGEHRARSGRVSYNFSPRCASYARSGAQVVPTRWKRDRILFRAMTACWHPVMDCAVCMRRGVGSRMSGRGGTQWILVSSGHGRARARVTRTGACRCLIPRNGAARSEFHDRADRRTLGHQTGRRVLVTRPRAAMAGRYEYPLRPATSRHSRPNPTSLHTAQSITGCQHAVIARKEYRSRFPRCGHTWAPERAMRRIVEEKFVADTPTARTCSPGAVKRQDHSIRCAITTST